LDVFCGAGSRKTQHRLDPLAVLLRLPGVRLPTGPVGCGYAAGVDTGEWTLTDGDLAKRRRGAV